MLIFAIVFSGLATLGASVGLGLVGHPIDHQSVTGYGWSFAICAFALAGYVLFLRKDRQNHRS